MELGLRTQFSFRLPKGYVDSDGRVHRRGEMRLATARDEIEPLRDQRVAQNDAYLTVLVLARVITRIGEITDVTTDVIETLFAADLAYLQDFYGIANFGDPSQLETEFPDEDDVIVITNDVVIQQEDGPALRESMIEQIPNLQPPLSRGTVEELPTPVEA